MERNEAIEIQRHLLDAGRAIDRAHLAITGLGKEDKRKFGGPLATDLKPPPSDREISDPSQYPSLGPGPSSTLHIRGRYRRSHPFGRHSALAENGHGGGQGG
jgi:hypothetical protein